MVSDKPARRGRPSRLVVLAGSLGLAAGGLAGCRPGTGERPASSGRISVVAAEDQYGSVASQVGGRYVTVSSIMSNPNTDPHDYELSPGVASEVASAKILIQNGLGYDDFMSKLEAATPSAGRRVIDVQLLLGLPDSTPNPHLWYSPRTMPKVAARLAEDLAALQPAHAAYFHANARRFVVSLDPWLAAIASFKERFARTPVACTEPVADYLLQAVGADILTPFRFQAAVMNGIDPSPQDIALEQSLLSGRRVRMFVYNVQVTDSLTESFIADARAAGIPVVGVYETMPQPGFDYVSWMEAEMRAFERAVADRVSTVRL